MKKIDDIVLSGRIERIIWKQVNDNNKKIVSFAISQCLENCDLLPKINKVTIKDYQGLLKEEQFYNISGYLEKESNKPTFIVNEIEMIDEVPIQMFKRFLSSKLFHKFSDLDIKRIIGIEKITNMSDFKENLDEIENVISYTEFAKIKNKMKNKWNEIIFKEFMFYKNMDSNIIYQYIKFYKKENILAKVQEDPYEIIFFNPTLDIKQIDKIKENWVNVFVDNFNSDDSKYLAYTYYCLYEVMNNTGSTLISINEIVNQFYTHFPNLKNGSTVNIKDFFEDIFKYLLKRNLIIAKKGTQNIIATQFEKMEKWIFSYLKKLSNRKNQKIWKEDLNINNEIDEEQKNAIRMLLDNNVSIISGIPGSGKSTIIKYAYQILQHNVGVEKIAILTPTGKSACNLKDKFGFELGYANIKTIHSFLGWNKVENKFEFNNEIPLKVEYIFIDEVSMVDLELLYALFIATPYLKKIVLVGDYNQLVSIRPGQILKDLIESKKIPTLILEKNYRSLDSKGILDNALELLNDKVPTLDVKDAMFFERPLKSLENEILLMVKQYFDTSSENNKYNQLLNFQILAPMYDIKGGINDLNKLIQKYLFDGEIPLLFAKETFGVDYFKGDKIMNLENDNDKGIFNGDIGFIEKVVRKGEKVDEIECNFNGKIIHFELNNFIRNIKLAYAISVHKFQGSECLEIILVLYKNQKNLLSKSLLYTAMSRAKTKLLVIGEKQGFNLAIDNKNNKDRNTLLKSLLEKYNFDKNIDVDEI